MEKTMRINAIIRYIETHIKEAVDYRDLAAAVAVSYRQLREDFRFHTGMPLKKYILSRKIAYAAFAIETTAAGLLDIALSYGFEAYDTFTRTFKREIGMTPSQYRKWGVRKVRRGLIAMGTYGPVLNDGNRNLSIPATNDDLILYGVPQVGYATGKCIPLAACLESLLTYSGQREHHSYMWLTAATAIAFRLCWNPGVWDMGNPDIRNSSPDDPWSIYRSAFQAGGFRYRILHRDDSSKEGFICEIRRNLAIGLPVIALGIIGPPEPCIITGYIEEENQLLGWNYFQDNPEFAGNVSRDPSGYFITAKWWENPATLAIMTLAEAAPVPSCSQIIRRISNTMEPASAGTYHLGQLAYDSWIADLQDDRGFDERNITPILLRRYFCQADGETMIGEGRYWGSLFFRQLSQDHPAIRRQCRDAAHLLAEISAIAEEMTRIRQGRDQTEQSVRLLCQPEIRHALTVLIREAQKREKTVLSILQDLANHL